MLGCRKHPACHAASWACGTELAQQRVLQGFVTHKNQHCTTDVMASVWASLQHRSSARHRFSPGRQAFSAQPVACCCVSCARLWTTMFSTHPCLDFFSNMLMQTVAMTWMRTKMRVPTQYAMLAVLPQLLQRAAAAHVVAKIKSSERSPRDQK